ncbi:efflux RND transporter periplasmic adaptor subunit [Desulfosudis oleivorans]|uniref:Efflux transporter, RND family, MFP subunit n=1 Tax=Desulfosudis oleivorans (strain DSM 6200 / JCM 39069 / Hxd3) TaxID=96561 RepID=A8ZXR4_DESOH|nr:efflux RND transporter periplasmic adaptor subunit [Desulfosudis oleivorans]ABW67022.1 efflux transporter, RND family, MFP subunit [Desulfosudis oleivorans Hxd3]
MNTPYTEGPIKRPLAKRTLRAILGYGVPALVIVLLIVIFMARKAGVDTRRQAELGQDQAAVNVVTYTVAPRDISDRINLPGTLSAWVNLNVVSQVAGEVLEKNARDGAVVKKNEKLAVIDSRKYKNAYDAANASLESALATQQRLTELYREQLASKSDLDAANAAVENYRAAMETAALDLDRCVIRAPIAGIINRVFIEKGQVLAPGQEVAEILQIDPVKVTVGIPESDVPSVRGLEEFTVTIAALGGQTFSGKKHFLSKTADPMARLYDLEILVKNPDARILPDMFARVNVVKKTVENAVVIPLYAVTSNAVHTVMVEKEGMVHRREVTLGITEGFNVEISSGLAFGEQVVVMGQKQVADGQPVNVTRTVTDPEAAMQ